MEVKTKGLQLIKAEHFGEVEADIYSNGNDMFMTAAQLGECLEYSNPIIAINKLATRNKYLQNDEFSVVTKLVSTDGKHYKTRVFNEDGIYEVSFLAKTAKAQEFRRWVRGILKSLRSGELKLTQGNMTITPDVVNLAIKKHIGIMEQNIFTYLDKRMNTISNSFQYIVKLLEQNSKPLIETDKAWKNKIYTLADKIVKQQPNTYKDSKAVLHTLYIQLNKVYGVVWNQEQREYRERHNITGNAKSLELISEKETLKSITENCLTDMLNNEQKRQEYSKSIETPKDIIAPLIEKYNDKTKGGNMTFRIVYKNMGCGWDNLMTRYRKKHNTKNNPSKQEIVKSNPTVNRKFRKTVKQLLNED